MTHQARWLAVTITLCFIGAWIWWRASGAGLTGGLIIAAVGAATVAMIFIVARFANLASRRVRRKESAALRGSNVLGPIAHDPDVLSCSFCGKPEEMVRTLVQAVAKLDDGRRLCICDDCVSICVEILDVDPKSGGKAPAFG